MYPPIAGSDVATGSIDKHIATVMNGVADTAMNAFSGKLSDSEIAAVITYQRNAFDNGTGDTLQPSHIKSLREGSVTRLTDIATAIPELNNTAGVN